MTLRHGSAEAPLSQSSPQLLIRNFALTTTEEMLHTHKMITILDSTSSIRTGGIAIGNALAVHLGWRSVLLPSRVIEAGRLK